MLAMSLSFVACTEAQPESLVITPPTKVTYFVGATELDLSGGKVAVKYTNGSVKDEVALDDADVVISSYSFATVGTISVTVTYKELSGTFNITVATEGTIEITTLPYKTSYGPKAAVQNVERRGGVLTVDLSDGTSQTVPLTDPAASVKEIDVNAGKITIEYKGMTADYPITLNPDEIGYMTVTQQPVRLKYRPDATLVDVDFAGGQFNLVVDGIFRGSFLMDSSAPGVTKVRAADIDIDRKFVTCQYDISSFVGYTAVAEGYFDITVVSDWPVSVRVKQGAFPDKLSYTAEAAIAGDADLTGGKLIVTYKNGSEAELNLPNSKISATLGFDPEDCETAIITLRYWDDEIATAAEISCAYTVEVTNHTKATMLVYCASVLPDTATLDWDANSSIVTERQRDIALLGVSIYLDGELDADRSKFNKERDVVVSFALYAGLLDINVSWAEFINLYEQLLEDATTTTSFMIFCNNFNDEYNDFFNRFNNPLFANIILTGNITVSIGLNNLKVFRDTNLTPYITSVPRAKNILDRFEKFSMPATKAEIKAEADDMENDSNDTLQAFGLIYATAYFSGQLALSALLEVLLTWRWDCIDIIYDCFYGNDAYLGPLRQYGVYPYIVRQLMSTATNMTYYLFNSDDDLFIYYYNAYYMLYDELFSQNYPYVSAPEMFYDIYFVVFFDPGYIGGNGGLDYYELTFAEIELAANKRFEFLGG